MDFEHSDHFFRLGDLGRYPAFDAEKKTLTTNSRISFPEWVSLFWRTRVLHDWTLFCTSLSGPKSKRVSASGEHSCEHSFLGSCYFHWANFRTGSRQVHQKSNDSTRMAGSVMLNLIVFVSFAALESPCDRRF